ncbi:MAG TPA: hypothetical protein VMF14_11235 [Solirubrobacteraceae bacterium]|nr:hypothetical protein [Solirubrobacteraceae bacterium]
MVTVRVVGAIELIDDGQPMQPPAGRPARSLLGWLATHPGRHSRAAVASALWPDVRDDSARASLRTALSAVRDALGPAAATALITDRSSVQLADAPDVIVDVREFRRWLDAGSRRPRWTRCPAATCFPSLTRSGSCPSATATATA